MNETPSSETRLQEGEFWDALKDYFNEKGIPLEIGNHHFRNYCRIALGRTGFSLNFTLNTLKSRLCCEIYINGKNAKKAFSLLEKDKRDVEAIIGPNLIWQRDVPQGQGSRIALYREGNIWEKKIWPDYFEWFKEYGLKFRQAFVGRIKAIKF